MLQSTKVLLVLLFALFLKVDGHAQVPGVPIGVPVGTGIGVGIKLTSTYPLPYANLAADYRSVYLYRASEFGFVDGEIESKGIFGIGWDVASAQRSPLRKFTIRFKEVDWNVMPSDPDMSGATIVYYTPTYVESPGLNWHNFADAYCWDGTKNLAVEVCVTNPADDFSLNAKVAVAPPFGLEMASWHEWNNSGNSVCDDPGSGNGMLYLDRPIAHFRILPGSKTDIGVVSSIEPEEVLESGLSYPVDLTVQNLSCNVVDTLVLEYQWMNDPIVSDTIFNLDLQPGHYYKHQFQQDLFANPIGFNEFKLWINNANDLNHSNDTLHKLIWVKDADFTGLDFNGKEFWGAFMANYNNGPTLKQYLYITSPNGANVTVSFPLLGWTRSFYVSSKDLYTLEIPVNILQELIANDTSEVVKPTSYFVKADEAVTVYGMSTQYQSTDAFLSIPKRSLGYEYKVISPEGTFLPGAAATGGLYTDAPSEFVVVATENNTEVKIVSPVPTMLHEAGDTIRVTLNEGENFLVKGRVDYALGLSTKTYELTGTHVLSDKRVAVISGAQCAMIPSQSKLGCQACDHLLEQTQPISTLGKRFITVDFEYKPGNDYLQIFNPNNDSIQVNIKGDVNQSFYVAANKYKDIAFQGGMVVETSQSAVVAQMCTGGQCLPISMTDPFYTNIISENQWANVFSYANTAGFNIGVHYISVIKRSEKGRIAIDGNKLHASKFTQIPGTDYYYARLQSAAGKHRITGDSLFVTYVYGFGYDDSYGYPASGALLIPADVPEVEGFATATPSKCYNDSTGSAWVEIFGGTAPFVINWDNGEHTDTINNLAPGRYIVQVVDDFGMSFKDTVWVTSPDTLGFSKTVTDVACNGDSTGSVMYTPFGGIAPYSVWYQSEIQNPLNNLAEGWHFAILTDANGCATEDSTYISENTPLELFGATQMPDCFNGNNAELALTAIGGIENYAFFIDGVANQSASNLSPGNHSAQVVDALGCTTDSVFVIENPEEIIVSIDKTPVGCYGDSLGSFTVNASGGRGPLQYIFQGDTSYTTVYENLVANTYRIYVTDGFCTKTMRFLIDSISSPLFAITTVEDRCIMTNGEAHVTGNYGSGNYQYAWNGNAFSNDAFVTDLSAGNHTLVATDGVCIDTLAFTIDAIQVPEFIANSNPEICDNNNGSITFSPHQYWKGYEWYIDGVQQQNLLSNALDSGWYHVSMTDSACSISQNVFVDIVPKFIIDEIIRNEPTCNASNGEIEVRVLDGASQTKIKWVGRSETTFSLTGLPQGIYTAVLYDNLCSDTIQISLNNVDGPQIGIQFFDAHCELNNGEIQVNASGGTGQYTYRWPDFPSNATSKASNLSPGHYNVFVSDDVCENGVDVVIKDIPKLDVSYTTKNEHCELNDGLLELTFTHAIGTVEYVIDGAAPIEYNQPIAIGEGTYTLKVIDDFCFVDTVFSIGKYDLPILQYVLQDEHCSGNNASINLSGTSYNGSLNYYLGDTINSTSNPINNLASGTYFIAISDGYCFDSARVDVINYPVPQAYLSTNPDHCGNGVGTAVLDSVTGTGSIVFELNNIQYSVGDEITGLNNGSHAWIITDSLCSTNGNVSVGNVLPPVIITDSIKDLSCGQSNGLIHLSASGTESSYTILWDDGNTQWQRDNLPAGVYTATISGVHCSVTESFTINVLPVFGGSVNELHAAYCQGQKGALTVAYQNERGNVVLNIAGQQFLNPTQVKFLPTGNYPYTLSDDYCSVTGNVNIGVGPDLDLTLLSTINDTCDKATGSVNTQLSNAFGTIMYRLNGAVVQLPITNLPKGQYRLEVEDDFCSDYIEFNIIGLDPPNGNLIVDQLDACEKSIGIARYSSNETNLIYTWDNVLGDSIQDNLAEGNHELIVQNEFCTDTLPFELDAYPDFVVDKKAANDFCNLGQGSVTIDVNGSTAPYTVLAYDSEWPVMYKDENLSYGEYQYTVVDTFGCTQMVTALIDNVDKKLDKGYIYTQPGEIIVGDSVQLAFWLEEGWNFDYWIINGEVVTIINPLVAFDRLNDVALVELYVVHDNFCTDVLKTRISPTTDGIVYAPNAFTPNGDGHNDVFFLSGVNIKSVEGSIYDRWGEEIIKFTNPSDTWNGMYKGKLVQIDVYNYRFMVEFESGFKKQVFGSVRVIR